MYFYFQQTTKSIKGEESLAMLIWGYYSLLEYILENFEQNDLFTSAQYGFIGGDALQILLYLVRSGSSRIPLKKKKKRVRNA